MVFAKSGAEGSWVIAAISAEWSAKACSKAGRKCSGAISAKGGVSNGVCQACSSGFAGACGLTAVSKVSDIRIPVFDPIYCGRYSTRWGFFRPLLRLIAGAFSERLRAPTGQSPMSSQPAPTSARQINWPSVVTVISAAILIGAEVFGAAFAGGWALAILLGLSDTSPHILQAVLFAIGVVVVAAVLPRGQPPEPFNR